MPVNKIINKKSGYYVAMYSAHASIIENLIGKNGTLKNLLIDAGGLKAPKGSYSDRAIFNNYSPVTNKTLHAKIIYLDKLKTLSLWTGNLRKQTFDGQENIVITIEKMSAKNGRVVKKWFSASARKEHLIINISNSSISKVTCTKNNIWSSFKESLEKIQSKDNDEYSLYAFSPWGSSRFIRQTVALLRNRLTKISLYTRPEAAKNHLWIDTGVENQNDNMRIERFVKKNNSPFPHYKCVFMTRKDDKKEKLIWAYVGSANLTEVAFFKNSNIEFGVFHDNIRSGSEIDKIFNELKKRARWEQRIRLTSKKNSIDESEQGYGEEYDDQANFEIRRISKDLCKKLKTIKWQTKLEDGYKNHEQIKLNKCIIKVMAVLDGIFDLHVRHTEKKLNFTLPIKRNNGKPIYSLEDAKELVDKLLEISEPINRGVKGNSRTTSNKSEGGVIPPRNIRFPMAKFILNKDFIAEKKKIIRELSDAHERLTDDDKKIVDIWAQILKELR